MTEQPAIDAVPPQSLQQMFSKDVVIKQLARFSEGEEWSAFNPSVCYVDGHGFLVLLRGANGYLVDHRDDYRAEYGKEVEGKDSYEDPGQWRINAALSTSKDVLPYFRNRMFISDLDPDELTLGKIREVDLTKTYESVGHPMTRGIEDGRLYHDGKTLRISATAYETKLIPLARICSLPLTIKSTKAVGGKLEIFDSPSTELQSVEKNWMPIVKSPWLNTGAPPAFDFIYDSMHGYNSAKKELVDVGGYSLPIRGGSQVISLGDGTMLSIVHQVTLADIKRSSNIMEGTIMRRRYVHRFIQYDKTGKIIKVTDKFNFLNKSIEFASGIALYQDRVLVTFGALDCAAYIASIPLDKVHSALRQPSITGINVIRKV